MISACPAFDPAAPLVGELVSIVNCWAVALSKRGWEGFADPGRLSPVTTAFMVIAVALFGYRLLLGYSSSFQNWTLIVGRMGMVMVLTSQWPAWNNLVVSLTSETPAWVVQTIASRGGTAPIEDNQLAGRADAISAGILTVIAKYQALTLESGTVSEQNSVVQPVGNAATIDKTVQERLENAHFWTVLSVAGSLVVVLCFQGVLLSLGPIFALLIMFQSTQDITYRWATALISTIFSHVFTIIIGFLFTDFLLVQLAVISGMIERKEDISQMSAKLEMISILFTLVQLVGLAGLARIGWSFDAKSRIDRLQRYWRTEPFGSRDPARSSNHNSSARPALLDQQTRAEGIAESIRIMQSRDDRTSQPRAATLMASSVTYNENRPASGREMRGARQTGGDQRRLGKLPLRNFRRDRR